MKYNPKQEILVLQVIKSLKYGTKEEIAERMKLEPFDKYADLIPNDKMLTLLIKRWEKGKVITSEVFDGERRYFLRDIPWLAKLQMIHVEGIPDTEAKKMLNELREHVKSVTATYPTEPKIADFVTVECVFETIDPILGGDIGKKERQLEFPRNYSDELYIRPNWLYGYFRENARLWNLTPSVAKYIMPSTGEFKVQPETFTTKQIRVKEGHCVYEAIKPKSRFVTVLHLPLKGFGDFDSVDKWIEAIKKIEMHPIRGLGANFKVFGGRMKLVEHRILDGTT